MINLKYPLALILAIFSVSCHQPLNNEQEVAALGVINNVLENASAEREQLNLEHYGYKKPFCDYLTQAVLKSVFADAHNFDYGDIEIRGPDCRVTFVTRKTDVGAVFTGQNMTRKGNPRDYIQGQLDRKRGWSKINNLGDEAYLFPKKNFVRILVMKDGLRFGLDYACTNRAVHEDGLKLMRAIMEVVD